MKRRERVDTINAKRIMHKHKFYDKKLTEDQENEQIRQKELMQKKKDEILRKRKEKKKLDESPYANSIQTSQNLPKFVHKNKNKPSRNMYNLDSLITKEDP